MSRLCIERGFDKIMIKIIPTLGFVLEMEKTRHDGKDCYEFRIFGTLCKKGWVDHADARRALDGMEERIRKEHACALEDDLRILSKVRNVLGNGQGRPTL